MNNFIEYVLLLSPSVLSIPRLGHLNTLDGYNRAVTLGGTQRWDKSNKGHAFNPILNGRYIIADGAEQDFTNQTIFVHFSKKYKSNGTTQFFVSKADAVNGNNWWFLTSTDYLYFYNSALSPQNSGSSGITMVGYNSCAVRTISNTSVDFFQNGTLIDTNGGLNFSTQPNSSIAIGSYFSGGNQCVTPIDLVCIFSSALTDQQISNIHTSFENVIIGYHPKKVFYFPPKDTKGAVIDLHGLPVNNVISDKSGNSNNGNVSGNVTFIKNPDMTYAKSVGSGTALVTIASNATIDNKHQHTVLIEKSTRTSGELAQGRVISKTDKYLMISFPGSRDDFYVTYSDGLAVWSINHTVAANVHNQMIMAHDKSSPLNLPRAWINGSEVTVTNPTPRAGSISSDAGSALALFDIPTATIREADCSISRFKLYPTILSDANIRDEYLKFALGYVRRPTSRFEYPITLGAKAAPNHVGPWSTWAGNQEYLDDGVNRYIKQTTTYAFASIQTKQVFGAWYFKCYRSSAATMAIQFMSNQPDANFVGSSQTGYMIYTPSTNCTLYRTTGGGTALLNQTGNGWLPSSGEIEFFITRTCTTGLFTVYTREATHTTWTQAFQTTCKTYVSTIAFQIYLVSATTFQFSDLITWPYGDSLTPNDIPEIAD